jgi:hypothetical protein
MNIIAELSHFETGTIAFVAGIVTGIVIEWKYGSKVVAAVKADVSTAATTVATDIKKV